MDNSLTIERWKNLIKFLRINKEKDEQKLPTLCKDASGVPQRGSLPCSKKHPTTGEYIVQCEDCPFYSPDNAQIAIDELETLLKKYKFILILKGDSIE